MSEKAIKEESSINLDSAFVKEDDRVLDPTLIDKSILERMPQPTGWRMLVLPYKGKGMTEGGIQLVKETIERESLATVVAYVVAMGPDCYKDAKRFEKPWCQEKQWVLVGRYAGARFNIDGGDMRLLNDDEILATVNNPEDILQ